MSENGNHAPFGINIFVVEGRPDGMKIIQKTNWDGLGIVCPRGRYPFVKSRNEFELSGVYILYGYDDHHDRLMIYVGETETIRNRLDSHFANEKDKKFWQRVIIFTRHNTTPLHKTCTEFLEARLVQRAKEVGRCQIENNNTPKEPTLSEMDNATMTTYLSEMLSLLPIIGIHVFDPVMAENSSKTYYFTGKEWDAQGYPTSNGFAVKKDSHVRKKPVKSFMSFSHNKRNALLDGNILILKDKCLRFDRDYDFNSPSEAASIVSGKNENGRMVWKDEEGTTLKEHQEIEAKKAPSS